MALASVMSSGSYNMYDTLSWSYDTNGLFIGSYLIIGTRMDLALAKDLWDLAFFNEAWNYIGWKIMNQAART